MIYLGLGAALPALLMVSTGTLDSETERHFMKIADSVAMVGTCQQHDFTVDVAGIETWKGKALDMAVASGMTREDAQARLDKEIAGEYERVEGMFTQAKRMAQSPDHVSRFNYRMKRDCERLASDELAGAYFTEG